MLGVVEELDPVVAACVGHGRDSEKAVLHDHDGVGLAILPETAVRQGETRGHPVTLAGDGRREVRVFDDLGDGGG